MWLIGLERMHSQKIARVNMAAAVKRTRSPVWIYFSVCENTKFAKCKVCSKEVSRGGNTAKSYITTNLKSHLKKHPDVYKECLSKEEDATRDSVAVSSASQGGVQLTLHQSIAHTRLWDINDPKGQAVHRKVGEMIALDFQPLSIVDDRGFSSLLQLLEPRYVMPSRRYMTEVVIIRIYNGLVKEAYQNLLLLLKYLHIFHLHTNRHFPFDRCDNSTKVHQSSNF